MKVAIPVWGERVSPVFDTSETLIVVDLDGWREDSRYRVEMQSRSLPDRVKRLTANGVVVLLCGAVSRPLFNMVEAAGIEVMPFLSGNVETLLKAFIEHRISDPQFLMPGCCGRRRRRRSGRPNRSSGEREMT